MRTGYAGDSVAFAPPGGGVELARNMPLGRVTSQFTRRPDRLNSLAREFQYSKSHGVSNGIFEYSKHRVTIVDERLRTNEGVKIRNLNASILSNAGPVEQPTLSAIV